MIEFSGRDTQQLWHMFVAIGRLGIPLDHTEISISWDDTLTIFNFAPGYDISVNEKGRTYVDRTAGNYRHIVNSKIPR